MPLCQHQLMLEPSGLAFPPSTQEPLEADHISRVSFISTGIRASTLKTEATDNLKLSEQHEYCSQGRHIDHSCSGACKHPFPLHAAVQMLVRHCCAKLLPHTLIDIMTYFQYECCIDAPEICLTTSFSCVVQSVLFVIVILISSFIYTYFFPCNGKAE